MEIAAQKMIEKTKIVRSISSIFYYGFTFLIIVIRPSSPFINYKNWSN